MEARYMRKFQKISLSGAMIFALAVGLNPGSAHAESKGAAHEDGSYYYYEVDEHGDKIRYIDGLTKVELEEKLGYSYNGDRSHYYYELNEYGDKTKYIDGLTKEELEERLNHSGMQSESHSGGHMNHSDRK